MHHHFNALHMELPFLKKKKNGITAYCQKSKQKTGNYRSVGPSFLQYTADEGSACPPWHRLR
jgi:hypothetical protein